MIEYLFIPAAYLLGSVSSAIIVCRLMGLPDPRTQGSNTPGATNVLRIGGKKAAALTLLGDSLKGFVPVFAAYLLAVERHRPAAQRIRTARLPLTDLPQIRRRHFRDGLEEGLAIARLEPIPGMLGTETTAQLGVAQHVTADRVSPEERPDAGGGRADADQARGRCRRPTFGDHPRQAGDGRVPKQGRQG